MTLNVETFEHIDRTEYLHKSIFHFQVILAIIIGYVLCTIFTYTNVFPNDPESPNYASRTDIRVGVISDAKWFRFPYPVQWGAPTVTIAGVVGFMAGIVSSIIESIGDYYACARYGVFKFLEIDRQII